MNRTCHATCLALLLSLGWGKHFLIKTVDNGNTEDNDEPGTLREVGQNYGDYGQAANAGAPALPPPKRTTKLQKLRRDCRFTNGCPDWDWD